MTRLIKKNIMKNIMKVVCLVLVVFIVLIIGFGVIDDDADARMFFELSCNEKYGVDGWIEVDANFSERKSFGSLYFGQVTVCKQRGLE